jgi:hypothetical protein
MVTEMGVSYRLNRYSSSARPRSTEEPQRIYLNSDVGIMWNHGASWAVGGSLYGGALVDYAFTVRLGAKARIRKWLTEGMAIDLGAGPLVGSVPLGGGSYVMGVGITTSAELVFTDRVSIINTVEWMPHNGGTDTAWYLGGRLGSWPGVIASGIAAVLMGIGAGMTM